MAEGEGWLIALFLLIAGVFVALGYWIWDRSKALKLTHLGSGKMTMDGTEQTVFEFERKEPFKLEGYVDLKPMQIGDIIIIREYMRLGIDRQYGLYQTDEYRDVQTKPMVYITPKPSLYGVKITLQQTAGAFKSFVWEFYMGVTS